MRMFKRGQTVEEEDTLCVPHMDKKASKDLVKMLTEAGETVIILRETSLSLTLDKSSLSRKEAVMPKATQQCSIMCRCSRKCHKLHRKDSHARILKRHQGNTPCAQMVLPNGQYL